MTCHSANSAHFVRRSLVTWLPKCRSGSVHRLRRPTSQSTTASAATHLTARHTHFSDRARTTLLPCAAPDAYFTVHGKRHGDCLQVATALPANSAGSTIVADQGQEVCLERRPFPLPPLPPTPLRRSSLAAAAKRPLAVSVGSARPILKGFS